MIFGHGNADFYVNSAAAVAQAVKTRLLLFAGEWFLDTSVGTAWATRVLGNRTASTYDPTIKARILGTQGVKSIVPGSYKSTVTARRRLSVTCTVDTIYGHTTVTSAIIAPSPPPPPPTPGLFTSAYVPSLVL